MVYDIFFDCPQCSHTIKVSSDLVGVKVECPDCGNEFKVPEIRDGLNPRLRSQLPVSGSRKLPETVELLEKLGGLEKDLRSLLRRQVEQIKQIDFIEGNATLMLKQLRLLETSASVEEEEGGTPDPGSPEKPLARASTTGWLRWSQICGWLTLGVGLVFVVLLLRAD